MQPLQNLTNTNPPTAEAVNPADAKPLLKPQQQLYIDYCAVQGLVTEEDGKVKTMSAADFADHIGYSRQTLYDWQKSIPEFWVLVNNRRVELGGNNRIAKVWNGLYLKAATGDSKAAALWLANHDPNFRMPAQKVEHGMEGGLADLLNKAREIRLQAGDNNAGIVEGEVVEAPNS